MPFRILSLSGGGARGIYQAVFLSRLQSLLGGRLSKSFDLIAGTSTGAIVGAAVAFDIDLQRVIDLFQNEAPKIFDKKVAAGFRKGPRYSSTRLEKALKDVFEGRLLGDAHTRLLLTAASLDRFGHRLFSSDDDAISVVDAIASSAAAPTFFKPVKPIGSQRTYVDGGMWANTPSLAAAIYAQTRYAVPFNDMYLLSVGNGFFPEGATAKGLEDARPYGPFAISSLFEMMFSAQATAADELAGRLVGADHVITVNDPLQEPIELDDAEGANSKLPALAEGAVGTHAPKIVRWYLREEEEHISLAPATPDEAARFPGASELHRCNVQTIRRGGIWKNEVTIVFALEDFAPALDPDFYFYVGRGNLDEDAFASFCDGLTPERSSDYVQVNHVRATLAGGRKVEFKADAVRCEKGFYVLRYVLADPVEDALEIEVSLDSFFDAAVGWYVYETTQHITGRLTVSFTAPFRTEDDAKFSSPLKPVYENRRVAKTYASRFTSNGPVGAGSSHKWLFVREDS